MTSTLENRSLALKPQMTGVAKIYCGKRSIASVLSRRLLHYVRLDAWSWW